MTKPTIYPSLFFALVALATWYAFSLTPAGLPHAALALLVLLAIAAAGATGLNWAVYTAALRWRDINEARSAAEIELAEARITLVRYLANLDSDQVEAFRMFRATIGVIPGVNTAPMYRLELAGRSIEWDFLTEWIEAGTQTHLPEVRRWSEGSSKREQAVTLTNFMTANRFAAPAAGNQPATWIDRDAAMNAIGYQEEE